MSISLALAPLTRGALSPKDLSGAGLSICRRDRGFCRSLGGLPHGVLGLGCRASSSLLALRFLDLHCISKYVYSLRCKRYGDCSPHMGPQQGQVLVFGYGSEHHLGTQSVAREDGQTDELPPTVTN